MLATALRFVVDAYRKDPKDKMFMFASKALDEFKTILKDYAKYSDNLLKNSNFGLLSAELQEVGNLIMKNYPFHCVYWTIILVIHLFTGFL